MGYLADSIDALASDVRIQHKYLEELDLTDEGLKVAARMRDIVALLSIASSLVDERVESIYWYGPSGNDRGTLAGLVKEDEC